MTPQELKNSILRLAIQAVAVASAVCAAHGGVDASFSAATIASNGVKAVGWGQAPMPAAGGSQLFVAPEGDDTAAGSYEKPFATVGRARDAVRAIKKAGKFPTANPGRGEGHCVRFASAGTGGAIQRTAATSSSTTSGATSAAAESS